MAKKRERIITYYLQALGDVAYTNRILSQNIEEEDACQLLLCKDGVRRDLWRCPSGKVLMIWCSRHNFADGGNFKIKVFSQEGKGQIRDITEWYKKRHEPKQKSWR